MRVDSGLWTTKLDQSSVKKVIPDVGGNFTIDPSILKRQISFIQEFGSAP